MGGLRLLLSVAAASFLGASLYLVFLIFSFDPGGDILSASFPVRNYPNEPVFGYSTIILTGDVMLGRTVMSKSLSRKDTNYPFLNVAETLRSADLVFINLENPLVSGCPISNSGLKFCADPGMVSGLNYAGVDVANLANNHIENYGTEGEVETERILTGAGISFVNGRNLVVKEINGTRFGFLGFNLVDKWPSGNDLEQIRSSKADVDVLIVAVHWGGEYTFVPTPAQREAAKSMIGSGADVLYGTHPHWVQPVEYINGKPVFYSLGNFIFDQMWSEETKKGMAVRLTYQDAVLVSGENLPVYITDFAQPAWVLE